MVEQTTFSLGIRSGGRHSVWGDTGWFYPGTGAAVLIQVPVVAGAGSAVARQVVHFP